MAKLIKTKMTVNKYNGLRLIGTGFSVSKATGEEVKSFTVSFDNNDEGYIRIEFDTKEAKRLKDYLNENFKEL